LVAIDIGHVQWEPFGNVCPDFLVAGSVAVEARRLNQNFVHRDGSIEGIESVERSLVEWLQRELPKIGAPTGDTSWSIFLQWRRPLPKLTPLRKDIVRRLKAIETDPPGPVHIIDIDPGLRLELRRAEWRYESRFILGAVDDRDRGGFIVSEALRNVQLCIDEKSRKSASTRHRFREWWLVLVDTTGLGIGRRDWLEIRGLNALAKGEWSKVVILSPEFPAESIEL